MSEIEVTERPYNVTCPNAQHLNQKFSCKLDILFVLLMLSFVMCNGYCVLS